MAVFDNGVKPEALAAEWRADLRMLWRPWQDKCLRMRRLIQTERRAPAVLGLTGNAKTDIEKAREYLSEYVTGAIAIIHRSAIGRVLNGKVVYRTAFSGGPKPEREAQSELERICSAFLAEQDRRVARHGRGSSWLRRAAVHSFVDGKIVNRVHVHPSPYDPSILAVDWDLLDPATVAHDFDSWPRRFLRDYRLGKEDARHLLESKRIEAGREVRRMLEGRGAVGMTELWVEDMVEKGRYAIWEAVMVEGKLAGDPQRTAFDRLPITVLCCNSELGAVDTPEAPAVLGDRGLNPDDILYHAQGFYSPVEHIHGIFNEFMSLGMEGIAWGLNRARYIKSEGGALTLGPHQLGPGATVPLDSAKGEAIEVDQASAEGIAELLTAFSAMVKAELNYLYNQALLGIGDPGESGYHYNSRVRPHALSVMKDHLLCIANSILFSTEETLHQWRKIPSLKVRFEGKAASGQEMGQFVLQEYDISRLPEAGSFALEVDVAPDIPVDNMTQLSYALQATEDRAGVGPLLDIETALQSMAVEDPGAIRRKLAEQRLEHNPIEQLRQYAEFLYGQAEVLEAQAQVARDAPTAARFGIHAGTLRDYARAVEAQLGVGARPQQPQLPAGPAAAPNTILPPQFTTNNPQTKAQVQGRPSTGTGGRPPALPETSGGPSPSRGGQSRGTVKKVRRDREGRIAMVEETRV